MMDRGSPGLYQHTLAKPTATVRGVGIHGGQLARVRVFPASANQGIVFWRSDSDQRYGASAASVFDEESALDSAMVADILAKGAVVRATWDNVVDTRCCTEIAHKQESSATAVKVQTIEHLIFAVMACGLDNVLIAIDAREVPILDGSAWPWVSLLKEAGTKQQNLFTRKFWRVRHPLSVFDTGTQGQAHLSPLAGDDVGAGGVDALMIDAAIDFAQPLIGYQRLCLSGGGQCWQEELAKARTFALSDQVQPMQQAGLLQGYRHDSQPHGMLCVSGDRLESGGCLRFPDEFVRHKMLDTLGDLFLLGGRLIGEIRTVRAGHRLNHRLAIEALQACALEPWHPAALVGQDSRL